MRLLGTMFRELRRRGVVRVAAAYLAVAFVVLQVTDLVVQPLHLPFWTLTLVILLLSAGFVLAVTLAWVFEITPDGLRRQADTSARKPWREGVDPFTAIFIIAAVGAVSIGIAFAWMAVPPAADGPPLDERQIMVMPARTAGADASLSYLGEGLLDLISAKLGDLDVQPIDARSTLAALRDTTAEEGKAGKGQTAATARRLGAGRIVVPEFVGRADALHLSATLLRARDNAPLARARVSGSENSIDSLTSVLLARLWAAADGELPERVGSISASLPALKAYLRGKGASRAGRHSEALADFRVALEHDSTFALAALAYTEGAWLSAGIPRDFDFTAQEIAWERRQQLNERDREYLGLLLRAWGERSQVNKPGEPLPFQTRGEALTAITRAAASGPERPELHFLLGDELFHFGQAMGESDSYGRADAAFRRAMALDTALPPQIYYHRGYLAAMRGDTTALRRIAELHQARFQTRSVALEWLLHFTTGDRSPLHEDSLGLDPGDNTALTSLYQITLHFGSDPGPVRRGLARARRSASPQLSIRLPSLEWQLAVNTGRPVDAARARSRAGADAPLFALAEALFDDLPPSERARLKTEAQVSAKSRPPELPESRAAWYRALCLSTLMEATHGDVAAVPAAASRLAAALSDDGLLFPVVTGGCASVARLLGEARTHPARILSLADSVEAFLRAAPAGDVLLRHVLNLLVAPVFEHNLNDVPRALAAVRRAETPVITLGYSLLAWKLREEGRLATASGDRTGAIQAYRRYLILRSDAEPPLRKRDDDIRAELARLTTLDRS